MRRDLHLLLSALSFAALTTACAEPPPPEVEAPRPVSVVELRTSDPVKPLQITGSVTSWSEQDISFEVSGPVAFIESVTTNLKGRWIDDGSVVDEGQMLARLNATEYELALGVAQANLSVSQEDVRLAQSQLAELLPARLSAAEANQKRAQAEYERFVEARKTDAVPEIDVIRHKADLDQRIAETQQALAEIDAKKVEIRSLESKVEQATQALNQAQYDLDRCTLWAPFSAEVSEVYVEAGGFARVSQPVAHLVMMDPIKVDVSMSAERAAALRRGDSVTLSPLTGGQAYGFVYEKATAADAETRTFRVSVMARNTRVMPQLPRDSALHQLPSIDRFVRVQRFDVGDPESPYFVEDRHALRQDDQGHYVWASDELPLGATLDRERPVLNFRRVRVTPGAERRNFQGLFVARALADADVLDQDWVVAYDPPEGFQGGELLVSIREWQLRPGQIVPVLLGVDTPQPGHYVPLRGLATDAANENKFVFVEEGGVARRVPVTVSEVIGESVRVQASDSPAATLLRDGARIILDSVHFLQDGEPVRVVRILESLP